MTNKLLRMLLILFPIALFSCAGGGDSQSSGALNYEKLFEMQSKIQTTLDNAVIGTIDGTYPQENYDQLSTALEDINMGISKSKANYFILQFEIDNYVNAAIKAIAMFEDSLIKTVEPGKPAELFVNGIDHKGYIDFGSSQDYCGGSQFTVETWTKYKEGYLEFAFGSFLSVFTSPAPYKGWTLHYWGVSGTQLRFSIGSGADLPTIATPAPETYGEWIHVAATFDATAKKLCLYINGVLKSSTEYATIDVSGDKRMWAFVEPLDNSRCMSGYIKNFRMWSSAKSQSDIQTLMNSQVTGTEGDLVCAWDFSIKPTDDTAIPDKTGKHTASLKGVFKWTELANN